jgi:hypothetical protein
MQSAYLKSLTDVPLSLDRPSKEGLAFRSGDHFSLRVVLANGGHQPIVWSDRHPLNLSYRWRDQKGALALGEGGRSPVPGGSIAASARIEAKVAGYAPSEPGRYKLQLSLVLEGVHWACDVEAPGWVGVDVEITAPPAWPANLRNSAGGRALRGALLAGELARQLADSPIGTHEAVQAAEGSRRAAGSDRPRRPLRAFRRWWREQFVVRPSS